ncbi:MAG: hypothetical protein K2O38_03335 [Muribaculaceae bacterium]|nr:hypothetical protein [Muribaculaceae bacterium]
MKKLFIASGLLALMAAATSCDKYDIYDEQYGDVMLIKDGGDVTMDVYSTDDYADRYISVLKGGHSPERTSTATLRVMTEQDFRDYKDQNYGDPEFGGLQMVDPSLFDLLDSNGNISQSIDYTFKGSDDRYFGANLRVKSHDYAEWYRAKSESETSSANFVIPIGLYSETDSVNEYNNVLIVSLNDLDPEVICDVADGTYDIQDLSRRVLIRDAGKGLVYEPEVYMSIPCKNPWGFAVRIDDTKAGLVNTFNGDSKNTIVLTALRNDDDNKRWELTDSRLIAKKNGGDEKEYPVVNFPAGVTKTRIPLKIYLDAIDPDENLDKNLVVPIKIANPTSNNSYPAIVWDSENTPDEDVIRNFIKPSQFYVGVRVIEAPLDLDDSCVTSNDCEPTEGSIAGLFDDDLSTFFHSGWTVAFERSAPYGSYLEITLPEEVNAVYFNITARNSNPCSPKEIHLYYSNNIDDEGSWTYFQKATNSKKLTAGQSFEIGKINKMFQAPETFKYMRFCVIQNDKGESLLSSSTSVYWNLAELKLYGKIQ